MDDMWLIVLGAGALLVRVGMALHECGASRSKNAAGAILRALLDVSVATIAFWAVGWRIVCWGAELPGVIEPAFDSRLFVYLAMTLIGTGIVSGALAERTRFFTLVVPSLLMGGVLIPVGLWCVRYGPGGAWGYIDVGGASVVHLAGAVCALAGTWVVGARTGKFNRDGSSNAIPGHSIPLAGLGALLMGVGWVPYMLGATLLAVGNRNLAAWNTVLAAAGGAVASMVFSQVRYRKPEALLTLTGLLGALVAVSGPAGTIPTWGALVLGAVAGVVVPWLILQLDLRFRIDDPTGVIGVHGGGGLLGTLAAGAALVGQRPMGVVWQLVGAVVVIVVVGGVSLGVFTVLKKTVGLRSTADEEFDGLDLGEHDVNAYPDFQQTMIKSYHLREA